MNQMDLAHIITHYINEKGDNVSPKKLQKLLYYVEAWNMVHLGTPLINEDFEAWVHGPVLPSVYRQLKEFGFNNLRVINEEEDAAEKEIAEIIKNNQLNEDQLSVVYSVLDKYGSMSAFELEILTHNESPWLEARAGIPPHISCNAIIPKQKMKSFYASLIA